MPESQFFRKFPWWMIIAGFIVAAGYLPTLSAPFDFIDDGNLVYPAPAETSGVGYLQRWWDKVVANVEHLGPFRPTLWLHWEVQANTLAADPLAWRLIRWLWTAMAATTLLWLMWELRIHPTAAMMATAAALWNPYRNEIWTSLTLAEGVAMPYALVALATARRANLSVRPWLWDIVSVTMLFICLGCKNTFAALVPALLLLRLLPDDGKPFAGWYRRWRVVLVYSAPLVLPVAHLIYFKWNWHPGQYETPGVSWDQAQRIVLWLKGAAGLDFLGLGLIGIVLSISLGRGAVGASFPRDWLRRYRTGLVASGFLLIAGAAIYLPLGMMAPRYTMPAIWGWDVFLGIILSGLLQMTPSRWSRLAWGGFSLGLAVMMIANVSRQEKLMARSGLLWETLTYLETTAAPGARIAWLSGDSENGHLNVEEGIHFQWHLIHRGRGDLRVQLYDLQGQPIQRVELGPPKWTVEEADYRIIAGTMSEPQPMWSLEQEFSTTYRFGRKQYVCRVESSTSRRPPPAIYINPWVGDYMTSTFELSAEEALKRLTPEGAGGVMPSAFLRGSSPSPSEQLP